MPKLLCLLLVVCFTQTAYAEPLTWYLPISRPNRQSTEGVSLTRIGPFSLMRIARPAVPAHLHTGSDFKRPSNNYINEPVYPAAQGIVVSMRDDGPYAQIIISHPLVQPHLWTVYEHIAGVRVTPGDTAYPDIPIARFMTTSELDKYGWQFDHLHFEVMRVAPKPRTPDHSRPHMRAGSYALVCFTRRTLDQYYYDPLPFFTAAWKMTTLSLTPSDSTLLTE